MVDEVPVGEAAVALQHVLDPPRRVVFFPDFLALGLDLGLGFAAAVAFFLRGEEGIDQ
jgi:hypothetical protein